MYLVSEGPTALSLYIAQGRSRKGICERARGSERSLSCCTPEINKRKLKRRAKGNDTQPSFNSLCLHRTSPILPAYLRTTLEIESHRPLWTLQSFDSSSSISNVEEIAMVCSQDGWCIITANKSHLRRHTSSSEQWNMTWRRKKICVHLPTRWSPPHLIWCSPSGGRSQEQFSVPRFRLLPLKPC